MIKNGTKFYHKGELMVVCLYQKEYDEYVCGSVKSAFRSGYFFFKENYILENLLENKELE